MCYCCILINKSVPGAKTLINAQKEFNIDEEHFAEVVDLAMSKLPDEDAGHAQTSALGQGLSVDLQLLS